MKASSLIFMIDQTTSNFSTVLALIIFIGKITTIRVRVSEIRVKKFRVKTT